MENVDEKDVPARCRYGGLNILQTFCSKEQNVWIKLKQNNGAIYLGSRQFSRQKWPTSLATHRLFLEAVPPSCWSPKAVTSGQLFSLWSIYSCRFLVGPSLHLFQFYHVSRSRVQTYLRSKFRLVINFDRFGYQQKL